MSELIGYVNGADVLLIISLVIFMIVFVVAAIYMITISKDTCDRLSHLPLTENENNGKE
ncbi:MAG: CcoQ/FixQ family Cbb3-type cytochrome c oxidase assembly chaperone [Bacteroidetes bacterium]|nr:CcoQ/FixQ family Cbb3-type cytochrome c oxidase assembly chaperone [Bacteroidota bacterium]